MRYLIAFIVNGLLMLALMLPSKADVYTSVEELAQLFSIERKMVNALTQYVDKTERRITKIKRYLEDFENIHSFSSLLGDSPDADDFEELAGNPLQAFHLMKRLTIDWKQFLRPQEDWKGVEDAMRTMDQQTFFSLPAEEDLQGTAKALLRLQTVYKLSTEKIVRGNIFGINTSTELKAQDCLYMGKNSFNLGLYSLSVEWFQEAYRLSILERNATVTPPQVVEFIDVAVKELSENMNSQGGVKESTITLLQNNGFNPSISMAQGKETAETIEEEYILGEAMDSFHDLTNYDALCRGEKLLSKKYLATLDCFFSSRGSAYFKLMPLKVERQHHDPEILVFHDVISENEIKELKEIARPYLSRGMVQGDKGGYTVSNVRTSKVAWINDLDHPLVDHLNNRIGEITRLSTKLYPEEHAEIMQIANYGTGGHYSGHYDFLFSTKTKEELRHISPEEIRMGDRVATFMFYLSDVLGGGATVFPKLGVALWPTKGSAAFWFNLKKSGEGDKRTLHGGCPVVYGSKWVSNKWIRERGQFSTRRCGLDQRY